MIKRIFKTIFIFSLIFGTTLTSNANVSVSDGSAFVTKAEFAANLNSLSNRMAQLENSLDAKIDSLVSSYLTRNGIWNGAKQTLLTSYFRAPNPIGQAMGYQAYVLNVFGDKKSLFKSTKSGLCYCNVDWYSVHGATDYSYWGYTKVAIDQTRNKNLSDDSLILSLYFLNSADNVLTVRSLTNSKSIAQGWSTGTLNKTFYLAAALPPTAIRTINPFFVTKDENYYLQFRAFVNIGYSDGTTIPTYTAGGLEFHVVEAVIY